MSMCSFSDTSYEMSIPDIHRFLHVLAAALILKHCNSSMFGSNRFTNPRGMTNSSVKSFRTCNFCRLLATQKWAIPLRPLLYKEAVSKGSHPKPYFNERAWVLDADKRGCYENWLAEMLYSVPGFGRNQK